MQGQLDKLLLTYTDQYPDVIRIRHQMQDLRQQLAQSNQRKQSARLAGTPVPLDNTVQMNPLYQQLKIQLSTTRSDAAASSARLGARSRCCNPSCAGARASPTRRTSPSELTRDYNVNRDVYQDLLKRRENARVSMNLDDEQRGLTFLIQNPAVMPLTPSGLRFMHFGLAGIALSLAIPFGLLFGLVRFDPRVRSVWQLERATGLTVLGDDPVLSDARRPASRSSAQRHAGIDRHGRCCGVSDPVRIEAEGTSMKTPGDKVFSERISNVTEARSARF